MEEILVAAIASEDPVLSIISQKSHRHGMSSEDVVVYDNSEIDKKFALDPEEFKVEYLKDAVTIQSNQLKELIKSIRDLPSNEERLKYLEVAKIPYLFNTQDMMDIMLLTPSIKTRLSIISMLGPRLKDPKAKLEEVLEMFRFSVEKERVSVVLKRRGTIINSETFTTNTDKQTKRRSSILSQRGGRSGGRGGLSRKRSTSMNNLAALLDLEDLPDEITTTTHSNHHQPHHSQSESAENSPLQTGTDSESSVVSEAAPILIPYAKPKYMRKASKTTEDIDFARKTIINGDDETIDLDDIQNHTFGSGWKKQSMDSNDEETRSYRSNSTTKNMSIRSDFNFTPRPGSARDVELLPQQASSSSPPLHTITNHSPVDDLVSSELSFNTASNSQTSSLSVLFAPVEYHNNIESSAVNFDPAPDSSEPLGFGHNDDEWAIESKQSPTTQTSGNLSSSKSESKLPTSIENNKNGEEEIPPPPVGCNCSIS